MLILWCHLEALLTFRAPCITGEVTGLGVGMSWAPEELTRDALQRALPFNSVLRQVIITGKSKIQHLICPQLCRIPGARHELRLLRLSQQFLKGTKCCSVLIPCTVSGVDGGPTKFVCSLRRERSPTWAYPACLCQSKVQCF